MTFALQMFAHTPPYVFAIFAVLVWQGVRALWTGAQPAWSLLVGPGAFALLGAALILRADHGAAALAASVAAALAGVPLGSATAPRILAIDGVTGAVTRAGSAVPLLRNMLVFTLQYALAVAQALQMADRHALTVAVCAVSGASIGTAVGCWLGVRARRRTAPGGVRS